MVKTYKTLGILGAGQLGMMSGIAARNLDIEPVFYDTHESAPAFQVNPIGFVGAWNDTSKLKSFAKAVDVISYEFENVPLATVEFLAELKPVFPAPKLLDISQHRIKEKTYLNSIGIKTTSFAPASVAADVLRTLELWGVDRCILKTCRFGYDGKGQVFFDRSEDNLELAWRKLGSDDIIVEAVIDFDYEISVVVAADISGDIQCYPVALNEHKNHILHKTIVPAPIPKDIADTAHEYARKLAKEVNLVGVLALEMFVTKSGEVLANEIAPRTHNSGHWSIDGAKTSQFENHVRAVCGLPLGSTELKHPSTMINLIGEDVLALDSYKSNKNAHIHLYGKDEIKPGRKMGHVTIISGEQP